MRSFTKSPKFILSRSFKYTLKAYKRRLSELLRLACLWQYQQAVFSHRKFSNIKFHFFGLKSHREAAALMLDLDSPPAISGNIKHNAFISEIPLPGSICIPHNLTSLIPLKNRSLDEILMGFEKSKRKSVKHAASGFLLRQVTDIKEIARLNQEMLIPYAVARHGTNVVQLQWEFVMGMAFKYGQLHLLLEDGLEVGCKIGYEYVCNNKRYWLSYRGGFPDFIFNDSHQYREKNVIFMYLQLQWALNNGFDCYDMAFNQAYTEGGAVQFKRTFGAELSTQGNYNYFYLRLPQTMAAEFYWEKPLFAVEGRNVVLHLGLPGGVSADEVTKRYKLLNYRRLDKVYLHCDSAPSSLQFEAVMNIYNDQKSPPALKVC